jgi:hypothetical protein
MSIEVKVSVEKGKSRLFQVEKAELTLIELRKIMEKKWAAVGSNFLFLMDGSELDRDFESQYKLSQFKKGDRIEVVISPQENSDDKKKGDKDSKSEAKGSKEEPENASKNQKSSQAQLKPEEKPNWGEKAPENDLIKDKGSYESKNKAYLNKLDPAEKAQLLKMLNLPKALKLTLSDGLMYVKKPGYKLSQAITENNFEHISPESIDKNEVCFTSLEKKAYEMLSHNVKASLKLPIPQLSAVFGLDVHHETTSETQTQSKRTRLFMVAKRILPKTRVFIDEENIQLTEEFKNSVAKADDIGKLSEVFNKYGYFVPTAYTIGGSIIVVKEENVSANDQKTASSKSFGLEVKAEFNKAGVTADGSVGYSNEKKHQSSETSVLSGSRYSKNVKGGDTSLENDPAKWASSLTFDKWAIVEYDDLKPITDFLPQDLKEKCKKLLTPPPLNKLPKAVADEMKKMAECAAWHAAHKVQNKSDKQTDALKARLDFNTHAVNVISELNQHGIKLSPPLLEDIKDAAWNIAWNSAHALLGKPEDGKKYESKFNQLCESIRNSNEVTKDLAEHIIDMCRHGAWHRANWQKNEDTMFGDSKAKQRATYDIMMHNDHYEKIYS